MGISIRRCSAMPCQVLHHHAAAQAGLWLFLGRHLVGCQGARPSPRDRLNPDHFRTRSAEAVLSTLVHEMCHLQQHHFRQAVAGGLSQQGMGRHDEGRGLDPSATGSRAD